MPMAALVLTDHLTGGDVQRGEQARGAIADVVVATAFGHHGQHRCGPVQCLHLRFLVHSQDHGLEIQFVTNHVGHCPESAAVEQLADIAESRLDAVNHSTKIGCHRKRRW